MSTARRIVITGCTRGLGRALARKLATLGHGIIGCGRSGAAIGELRQEFGSEHDFQALDVSDWAQVRSWAQRVLQERGVPDLVLNNAGLMNDPAPLWEVPPEEFSNVIDVNIKGVANVIRAFAPAMVARRAGVIVNFSSTWGRSTSANVAPYCATKWAIEGLSRALAQDLPEGMAAVSFNPGVIDTDMLHVAFGDGASRFQAPGEWAGKAAPFLLKIGPADNGMALSAP